MTEGEKERVRKLLDMTEEEKKFNDECAEKFKGFDMVGLGIFKVYDPDMPDSEEMLDEWDRLYFVDSIAKTIVKLTDEGQRKLAIRIYNFPITVEEEKWFLDYDRSKYFYFNNFEDLDEWESKKEELQYELEETDTKPFIILDELDKYARELAKKTFEN